VHSRSLSRARIHARAETDETTAPSVVRLPRSLHPEKEYTSRRRNSHRSRVRSGRGHGPRRSIVPAAVSCVATVTASVCVRPARVCHHVTAAIRAAIRGPQGPEGCRVRSPWPLALAESESAVSLFGVRALGRDSLRRQRDNARSIGARERLVPWEKWVDLPHVAAR